MQPNPVATPEGEELPDHLQLPFTDGKPMENLQERPQTELLATSLTAHLRRIQPDGQFLIGGNSGIYFGRTTAPLDGCRAPDFFVVLGVPPLLDGVMRRSYVLWKEHVRPSLLIEYVYVIAFVGMMSSDYRQRFGDRWADTYVVTD